MAEEQRGVATFWSQIKRPLQIIVAAALLLFILTKIPLYEIGEALQQTSLSLFVLATFLFLPTFWLQAVRWRLLFPREGEEPLPISLFLRLLFIGQFASLFLPSTVGGDAVRAVMLGKQRGGIGSATSSVLLGRIFGVAALLCFVWLGWAIAPEQLSPFPLFLPILIGFTLITALALLLIFLFPLHWSERWSKIRGLSGVIQNLSAVRRLPFSHTLLAVFLSIAIQFSSNLLTFFIYRAVGMPFPWEGIFTLIPILMLINLIPLSFFNIGVREGAMILLFTHLPGVTPALCIAASTIGYASVLFPAFIGFLLYIKRREA